MGPLPQLYKLLVAALLVLLCLGAGLWLAGYYELPLAGAGVGIAAGCALAWLMTHDFRRNRQRTVRVTRRR